MGEGTWCVMTKLSWESRTCDAISFSIAMGLVHEDRTYTAPRSVARVGVSRGRLANLD